MKKKSNKLILVIFILLIVFGAMIYMYSSSSNLTNTNYDLNNGTISQAIVSNQTIIKSISSSR